MFKQFLLRIFLVCSAPLLLILLWDVAHAGSAGLGRAQASGETSHLPDDDTSYQSTPHSPAEDEPVTTIEHSPDTTAAQPSIPPLLSDIEPLTATSAALLPPPVPGTRHLTPDTQHPTPNPPSLAQTVDDLPEVEFTPGGTLRITVTGTRTPRNVDDLPATVTVFELEDFEFNQVQDLRDLLRYEPGVSTRNDLRFGLQDVNIRGIEGNRILFQLDGIRLPERFQFGQFNLGRGDYVDFNTLQAVEVLRGPASTLYGSDALGGVISFRSLRPDDLLAPGQTFAAQLRPNYTSQDGGFNTAVRLAGRFEDLEGVFVFSRQDARETQVRAASEFINPQTRDGTTFFGNLVYWLNDYSHISLLGESLDRNSRINRNTSIPDSSTSFVGGLVDEVEDISTNRQRVGLSYEYNDPQNDSWLQFARGHIYYQDSRIGEAITRNILQGGTPFLRRDNNSFDSEILGGEVQLRSDFTTGLLSHQLTYGLDLSNTFNSRLRDGLQTNLTTGISTNVIGPNTFPVKDFPDGDTLRIGAYLQDEIRFGNLEIIAGLRFDYYNLSLREDEVFGRAGAEGADFSSSSLSPRLAVLYNISPEMSVYGQYARGFRAPLYSEISSGFTNTTSPFFKYRTISNSDLEPETSNSYEIGWRGRFDQFDLRVTGFYNTYNNFIETLRPAGTERLTPPFVGTPVVNLFQSQNITNARIYGFELAGEYRFSPDPDGFSLTAALGFAQGDDLSANEPLRSVDPFQGVVGLRYRAPENLWRAELVGTVVGTARVPEGTTTFVPPAYAVVDLIGAYNIRPNLGINLGLYNLLNSRYFIYNDVRSVPATAPDVDRFSQPGINVRLGVNYDF
ncbi:MAG: TonB-dependent hemoglobin/transferrin/lactoferrin family receptor [Nodosilinea sp.]